MIKTKEFILRPITLDDARGYLECHKDKEAKRNFMSVPKNLEEAKEEVADGIKKNLVFFAIEFNREFVGFINLKADRYLKNSAVLGMGVIKKFRNKGLATKAVRKVTEHGFKKIELERISGKCRTFNKASGKVMKKAGYKFKEILKKNKFVDDEVWVKMR
jgi:[ribosomal protein S5]-alanine N-acetyltransferase